MFEDISLLEPDWWADAICVTRDLTEFFGSEESYTSITAARVHCGVCPSKKDCLTHALGTPEEYGIWAGTSARNRELMLKDIKSGEYDFDTVVASVLDNSFRWSKKI